MKRILAKAGPADHGKFLMGGEPLVFHCNYYNYFLQKTLLLDETMGMEEVIRAAAAEMARGVLAEMQGRPPAEVLKVATHTFAELGFGVINLTQLAADGGDVRVPMSHYGSCLRAASGADFARPQSWFDAGFAVGACEVAYGLVPGRLDADLLACQSMGAPEGRIHVRAGDLVVYRTPGQGHHVSQVQIPPPLASQDPESQVDENTILSALAGLDFSGNEEGLIPRFGVMLTHHFGNFYNRISFEYLQRMANTGLIDAAEMLLTEAGHRCAFHTFGGIMTSPEWDAVVKPSCRTWKDWVYGITACINALGWGTWRVVALSDSRLVMRIYDDYESCGQLGMYGRSERPVSWLATGGCAGIMNLVLVGNINEKPSLDYDYYCRVFESSEAYEGRPVATLAEGADYTEIVVERTG